MGSQQSTHPAPRWRAGDTVEVRSLEEILGTLDENGELDALPFMPEMARFCGQRLTIHKVASKVCDTISASGMHKMEGTVHLAEARCDGAAHGGCQAACLMYWRVAWLRKVDGAAPHEAPTPSQERLAVPPMLTAATRRTPDADGAERYRCQATEILRAAPEKLPLRAVGQYVDDVRSGNVSAWFALRGLLIGLYNRVQAAIGRRVQPKSSNSRLGRRWGSIDGRLGPTPTARLDLQPGEQVRVRSRAEIAGTLDENHRNRGLGIDPEMARFCGTTARVARHIDHVIDESTGRMLTMKQPCIVLEDVVCEGAYNASCPRSITPYWREIWLERVPQTSPAPPDRVAVQVGARRD